jgi:ABC-type antimicrobial peptide transport system permease subunit
VLAAAAIGLLLVAAAIPLLRPLLETFLPVLRIPPESLLLGVALAAILGLASGGLPAWTAMRLEIVDALRRR